MVKKPSRKKLTIKSVRLNCPFCREKRNTDYRKVNELEKYTTDRGKIIGLNRSGLCQKHQRRMAKAIKRARFLAFLPFATQV